MRRYLRCPGAICCPARRALRAVLQPHIRFCDELIVVDRAEHVGELLGLVGERLGSVLKHRLLHGEHRQGDPRLLALFRLRSTGLGVAVGAIRSCRGRHRPRASPRSPNGPTRARLKPPGSPAAAHRARPLEKKGSLELGKPGTNFHKDQGRLASVRSRHRYYKLLGNWSTLNSYAYGATGNVDNRVPALYRIRAPFTLARRLVPGLGFGLGLGPIRLSAWWAERPGVACRAAAGARASTAAAGCARTHSVAELNTIASARTLVERIVCTNPNLSRRRPRRRSDGRVSAAGARASTASRRM
jgi:hypothetical protein